MSEEWLTAGGEGERGLDELAAGCGVSLASRNLEGQLAPARQTPTQDEHRVAVLVRIELEIGPESGRPDHPRMFEEVFTGHECRALTRTQREHHQVQHVGLSVELVRQPGQESRSHGCSEIACIELGLDPLRVEIHRDDVMAREGHHSLGESWRWSDDVDLPILGRIDGVSQTGEEPGEPMLGHAAESGIQRLPSALACPTTTETTMDAYSRFRAEKDEFFRDNPHSPIPHHERSSFGGLAYYEPSDQLRLDLIPEPADGTPIRVQTSDGQTREYHRAATVSFEVDGEHVTLTLLSQPDRPGYFLPFRDGTSGKETYGAGRYLDLDDPHDGTVHIDFNLAYNPYCAYDDAYSCPLPPHENWLTVPIRAGEKDYVTAS